MRRLGNVRRERATEGAGLAYGPIWSWLSCFAAGAEVRNWPISRATASGSSSMDSTYAPGTLSRGLVFASTVRTPLDDHNVRRQFRVITEAARLGTTWAPRELRHTFVSLL